MYVDRYLYLGKLPNWNIFLGKFWCISNLSFGICVSHEIVLFINFGQLSSESKIRVSGEGTNLESPAR